MYTFDHKHKPYVTRVLEAKKLKEKYVGCVPIIIKSSIPDIMKNKHKYIIPTDFTFGQFMYVLRNKIKINSSTAIYLLTENGIMVPASNTIGEIYSEHANHDEFLYLSCEKEEVFG